MHDHSHSCHTVVSGLSVRAGDTVILDGIDIAFSCGELTAIVGPNGGGKTTLLRAILGETAHAGTVGFFAPDGSTTKPRFGYVPQSVSFDRDTPVSVTDCMASALYARPVWLGPTAAQRRRIADSLSIVSAEGLMSRRIGELSGGELQRMLLAMAMTPVPNVLLLDEPVSAVDAAGMGMFYEIACGLRDRFDLSVIIVSHDITGISAHADRMILLAKTVLAQGSPAGVIADPAFRQIFGHLFVTAAPVHGHGTAEDAE
jgi:zinc transport system ATP-binding protein